jgi:hypothetical protein
VAAAAAVTGPAAEAEEDARLASAEAREKGNACFQKKQWEQVRKPHGMSYSSAWCNWWLRWLLQYRWLPASASGCLDLQCLSLPSLSSVQALRHYQRAGTLDPGCKLALSNQAAALLQLKRWEEAADAASQARFAHASAELAFGRWALHLLIMQMAVVQGLVLHACLNPFLKQTVFPAYHVLPAGSGHRFRLPEGAPPAGARVCWGGQPADGAAGYEGVWLGGLGKQISLCQAPVDCCFL